MRLPLLVGTILIWKLRICSGEADTKKINQADNAPFRKDLYPQEYKFEIPIPLVFSDDVGDSVISHSSSSAESGSLEDMSSLFSKKSLLLDTSSQEAVSTDTSSAIISKKKGQARGGSPALVAYWRKSKTRPKKKIRKAKPKITMVWKTKKTPHSHGPSSHGPPSHGPHYHGPPPPHHFHHGPPHHHHGPPHHYGWSPPHSHYGWRRPSPVVALWKENQKHAPKWKPKDHKLFRRVELVPEYLSDLRKRLTKGLGILPGPPKNLHNKKHISYHSGFYTEVQ